VGKLKDIDAATMFAAGALSAVEGTGMSEEDARKFVGHVCKEAASSGRRDDDDDDDDETLWDSTKGFLIPAGVGLGAFLLGANAQKDGRPDRGYFENAGNFIWDRIKRLMGVNESELWKSFTRADPHRQQREMAELMEMDRNSMPGPPFMHNVPRALYIRPEGDMSKDSLIIPEPEKIDQTLGSYLPAPKQTKQDK